MAGYSRQSTITTGNVILAADFNNEYNQLITAFGSSGHAHDGTTGNGPTLSLTAAVTGTLPVANGGSGATTLTDGGVLLGSGTGAVTAMSVLANSEMIVGDGTTDPVAESGATLRTSIGVGTGDSPQVTGIELGHATDTTITRSSAGVLAVEGNVMYHASGTDIPVTDGGTGVSTLTDGGVLLGSGTGAITAMGVLSDGQIIVGDGTTDPVAESGATARTSLGAAASGANNDITSINSIAIPTAQYTSAEETKLSGIEASADVTDITNVNAASATTVGTIGTGVWQGTAINQTYLVGQSGTNTGDESAASLTASGVVELATVAETNTGSDATRAVTPASLTGWTGDTGLVTVGTIGTGTWQGTAINQTYLTGQSGTNTGDEASSSATVSGTVELATDAETITGTDTERAVTPANVTAVLQAPGKFTGTTKGGDIASASPLIIDTDGDYFDVTGTTNYAAMTVAANRHFFLQFDGALTMTHHTTNLDLPGEANIITVAGDVGEFFSTGSNTVQCVNYTRADGKAVVGTSAIGVGLILALGG